MAMRDVMPDPDIYYICEDGTIRNKRTRRPLTPKAATCGLPQVQYYRNGLCKTQFLHRVIWTHFRGEDIPFLHEIEYRDGDCWNCSLDNLYLKDLSEEFTPLKRYPEFAISRDAVLLNTKTMNRIRPILPPSKDKLMFSFRVDGKSRTLSTGLIMWETFVEEGVSPNRIAYKDGDPSNCSLENLYLKDAGTKRPRKVIEEDGREFMPLEYYIYMTDGVKGERESGIPQHCRLGY